MVLEDGLELYYNNYKIRNGSYIKADITQRLKITTCLAHLIDQALSGITKSKYIIVKPKGEIQKKIDAGHEAKLWRNSVDLLLCQSHFMLFYVGVIFFLHISSSLVKIR